MLTFIISLSIKKILNNIYHQKGNWESSKPLANIRILDIGCGGGLLAEPMARLGGIVSAIDGSSSAIETARLHAKTSMLDITYTATSAEELALTDNQFDVVYASDVIEHPARCPRGTARPARTTRRT